MGYKIWKKHEIDYLILERENNTPYKDIAQFLDRSLQSVQRKAQKLNIVKKEWTKQEKYLLQYNIEQLGKSHKAISVILNRTLQATQRKASELNFKYDYIKNYPKKVPEYIIVLENYIDSRTKILHKDIQCNHTWKASPDSILAYHGCPYCKSNFNILKKSYLYIIEFPNSEELLDVYKIGVTNNIKRRIKQFGIFAKLILLLEFNTGNEALLIEKLYLKNVKHLLVYTNILISGNMETFYYE